MQHAVWSYDGVIYEMNVRQLTEEGTLSAAMRHLQHLKDMGVDIIWLMPIYPIGRSSAKGRLAPITPFRTTAQSIPSSAKWPTSTPLSRRLTASV